MSSSDSDPKPSSSSPDDVKPENPAPWIVSAAALVLKFGVILFAIWAAWLALRVFSGFNEPHHTPLSKTTRGFPDDPDSMIPAQELDRVENIASIPVHHLLQGHWEMASAGWSIQLRSLAGQSPNTVATALLEPPEWDKVLPPSEELEQLLEVISQFKPSAIRKDNLEILQLKTRGIQAAMFLDAGNPERVFLIRAMTQLSSDEPVMIEIFPSTLKGQSKSIRQVGSQEADLFPDESFVITDQGKQHLSLIVAPMPRNDLLEFWRKKGWQVIEMAPADGLPVTLRGVDESFQLEFINESQISTSFLATRIVQARDQRGE